jgi:hypothetical protein
MSSEEMRAELEIFVNQGLQQGWRGWPLKGDNSRSGSRKNRSRTASLRIWRGVRNDSVRWTAPLGVFALSA